MCAIVGAILRNTEGAYGVNRANEIMAHIWTQSKARGRDGRGFMLRGVLPELNRGIWFATRADHNDPPKLTRSHLSVTMIGNFRAEPTTEFVKDKKAIDQQPYSLGDWSIVHNGTIANDKELRSYAVNTSVDSAAIVELLQGVRPTLSDFTAAIKKLKGSYAIIASHREYKDRLFVAANYRPVWYAETDVGVFFASARNYFPEGVSPKMLKPYTSALFSNTSIVEQLPLKTASNDSNAALVVCSGGLDSVVSAVYAKKVLNKELHLIHFLYGSRAEGPEVDAIKAIAEHLDAKLTLFPLNIYSKGDSPLLDANGSMSVGEAGAEFAHEWVPARNLVMLSVATAFAEAHKITTIVLGNNMEEAGAYPDNEPEFIDRFNDIIPFAIGDGKNLEVIMPVGNLMKHEIVAMGIELNAPMHLTWSCYNAGALHCGVCGPCYMRRKAFEINNTNEVISYLGD